MIETLTAACETFNLFLVGHDINISTSGVQSISGPGVKPKPAARLGRRTFCLPKRKKSWCPPKGRGRMALTPRADVGDSVG